MELKQNWKNRQTTDISLLIVLHGIETKMAQANKGGFCF